MRHFPLCWSKPGREETRAFLRGFVAENIYRTVDCIRRWSGYEGGDCGSRGEAGSPQKIISSASISRLTSARRSGQMRRYLRSRVPSGGGLAEASQVEEREGGSATSFSHPAPRQRRSQSRWECLIVAAKLEKRTRGSPFRLTGEKKPLLRSVVSTMGDSLPHAWWTDWIEKGG